MTAPRRRWPRFTLRTLLVVVTVAGAFAWLAERQVSWACEREKCLGSNRCEASFRGTIDGPAAPFPLNLMGVQGYDDVWVSNEISDEELERIRRLFPDAKVTPCYETTEVGGLFPYFEATRQRQPADSPATQADRS